MYLTSTYTIFLLSGTYIILQEEIFAFLDFFNGTNYTLGRLFAFACALLGSLGNFISWRGYRLLMQRHYYEFICKFIKSRAFIIFGVFLPFVCIFPIPSIIGYPDFYVDGTPYRKITGTNAEVELMDGDSWRTESTVIIPAKINYLNKEYIITQIGKKCFFEPRGGNVWTERIVLQDGVTTLSTKAFSKCHYLTSVVIPNSVTTIDNRAFSCCCSLTSITIPKNVKSLGAYVFEECNSLETICFEGKTEMKEAFDFLNDCKNLSKVYVPLQYSDYYLNELLKYSKCTYHEEKDFDELKSVLYFYSPEEHEF